MHVSDGLPDLPGANPTSICSLTADLIAAGAILPDKPDAAPSPPSLPPAPAPQLTLSGDTGGLQMLADSVYTHQAYMPVASTSGAIASPPYTPLDPGVFGLDAAGGPEWSDDLWRLLVQGSPISASDLLEWPEVLPTPAPSGTSTSSAPALPNVIGPSPAPAAPPGEGPVHALNQAREFFGTLKTNLFSSWEVSSEFLDTALQLFMMRVNHLLPIVHRPTFAQRTTPPGLLLNMVALGSLFVGSEQARTQGEAIWCVDATAIGADEQARRLQGLRGLVGHRLA